MCMFQKTIAATAAFLVTLAIVHGCSPQGSSSTSNSATAEATRSSSQSGASSTSASVAPTETHAAVANEPVAPSAKPSAADPGSATTTNPPAAAGKPPSPPAPLKTETPPSATAENGGKPGTGAPKSDEPLFQGWPKPLAVIVATGMQMGYIEPCGCSGKENQLGGLSRRHSFLKKLAGDGWNV
ncbi:MAG TPA: hypothetical protein VKB78_05425, partial [Pirellulales bacterium]|nr:hypothetical protein [Pirellulales bacterium]